MHIRAIQKNGTDEPICGAGIETQMEQHGGEWTGRVALRHIHSHVISSGNYCKAQGTQLGSLEDLEGQDGEQGGREVQEGRDIRTHIADSSRYTAENNTTVQNNYPPIKKNIKNPSAHNTEHKQWQVKEGRGKDTRATPAVCNQGRRASITEAGYLNESRAETLKTYN